ncbi:protein MAIN-LIKE 1-like [Vicia villosa]|uniref:protein MAIN-LIKE 1-like n=1 Tax=Vicia villosa TaxID=3911 RepID=UPI00273CDB8A|nr:protein MAIN-LIKE 1-like [Vicia villosa]
MAFAERWHTETSSFHLPHGEITITLDDIACLLHILIRGTLLGNGRLTKEEAREVHIVELRDDHVDALEEVERTRNAHMRFSFLTQQYEAEFLAVQQTADNPIEDDIHRQRVLRCYFLFLLGTQLFMDTSSSYTNVVYLSYLSDAACIHEYN